MKQKSFFSKGNKEKNIIKKIKAWIYVERVFIKHTRKALHEWKKRREKSQSIKRVWKRHPERHSKSNQKKMLWRRRKEDKKDLKPLKVIKVYDFLLVSNREKVLPAAFFFSFRSATYPTFEYSVFLFLVSDVNRFWFVSGCSWVESLNWLAIVMFHHRKQFIFLLFPFSDDNKLKNFCKLVRNLRLFFDGRGIILEIITKVNYEGICNWILMRKEKIWFVVSMDLGFVLSPGNYFGASRISLISRKLRNVDHVT